MLCCDILYCIICYYTKFVWPYGKFWVELWYPIPYHAWSDCCVLYHVRLFCTEFYFTVHYQTILDDNYIILDHTVMYLPIRKLTTVSCVELYRLYSTILYCTVLFHAILCCTVLYHTIQYCTLLHYTILDCNVLNYTILDCNVLYHTILDRTGWFSKVWYRNAMYWSA